MTNRRVFRLQIDVSVLYSSCMGYLTLTKIYNHTRYERIEFKLERLGLNHGLELILILKL